MTTRKWNGGGTKKKKKEFIRLGKDGLSFASVFRSLGAGPATRS